MLADAKALWQISKSWLVGHLFLSGHSQCLGRKHSDQLNVFMSVLKLVNVLKEKNCGHKRSVLPNAKAQARGAK